MNDLTLVTFDWVPEKARGFVRDIRVRWALEEARLPYHVKSTPLESRGNEHFLHQPFGQVPWLIDGDISIFESGAILLYLGERHDALMPTDPHHHSAVIQWLFAAINSVEIASVPWSIFKFADDLDDTPGRRNLEKFLASKLQHMESVLANREWLVGTFSIADILMADVLRLVDRLSGLGKYPACRDYLERATARPAFVKAYEDQLAHFSAKD